MTKFFGNFMKYNLKNLAVTGKRNDQKNMKTSQLADEMIQEKEQHVNCL